uniref:Uncharacterized protein n=1 Tax=Glossina palpalis gambiensis TaxID=67801 RepID=A0A1B0C6J0_9MUSC
MSSNVKYAQIVAWTGFKDDYYIDEKSVMKSNSLGDVLRRSTVSILTALFEDFGESEKTMSQSCFVVISLALSNDEHFMGGSIVLLEMVCSVRGLGLAELMATIFRHLFLQAMHVIFVSARVVFEHILII